MGTGLRLSKSGRSFRQAHGANLARLSYHANQVSTKGQVVLPGPLRRRLDIRAGDPLDAKIENGRIVLTPQCKRPHRVKVVTDPVTGLPALSAGPQAPTMSSKEVEEILANFP